MKWKTRACHKIYICNKIDNLHFQTYKLLRKIFTLFFLFFWGPLLYAQEAVATAGGDMSNANGAVNFTYGEMAFVDFSASTGSVELGVQQAYPEIITQLSDISLVQNSIVAYPNPASDKLMLEIGNFENEQYQIELLDAQGKSILKTIGSQKTIEINTTHLASGAYLLLISNENVVLTTKKIIIN